MQEAGFSSVGLFIGLQGRVCKEIHTDVDKIGFSLLIGRGIWPFYILYQ